MPPLRADGLPPAVARRFEFERDSFAYPNELVWEYQFTNGAGRMTMRPRLPRPAYTHRCFVLTAAARRFQFHAGFDPDQPRLADEAYRQRVRAVLGRSPRRVSPPEQRIRFPGYTGLRQFSAAQERLLKAKCGGAWRSYVLRSHWRMVFSISRAHQQRTAGQLGDTIQRLGSAVVHLVRFPKLTINHGMILFAAEPGAGGWRFGAYDPNDPRRPAELTYHAATRTFELPANAYWPGGALDVIEIYRNWWL